MPLVEIRDLVKRYPIGGRHFTALKGITLTFVKGEFSGLIGPSGSGKTTLLNIVGSLDGPSEGSAVVLGHLLRGGSPTTFDRRLSLEFGTAAVRCLEKGRFGTMVALKSLKIHAVPLESAISQTKFVPPDCDAVLTARTLGICFGD